MAMNFNLKGTLYPSFKIGTSGPTLYQGTSLPSNSSGSDGDAYFYVNGGSSSLYIKGNSSWSQATLSQTGVTAGTYTTANIVVDSYGRITAASNGSSGSLLPFAYGTSGSSVTAPQATYSGGLALGNNTLAGGINSVAIGGNIDANGTDSGAQVTTGVNQGGISIGANSKNTGGGGNISIGFGAQSSSDITGGAIAIGAGALALGPLQTALGGGALASGSNSLALGAETHATGNLSIAIGRKVNAQGSNSIIISGAMNTSAAANEVVLGTMRFPILSGSNGQVLRTDGSGQFSWTNTVGGVVASGAVDGTGVAGGYYTDSVLADSSLKSPGSIKFSANGSYAYVLGYNGSNVIKFDINSGSSLGTFSITGAGSNQVQTLGLALNDTRMLVTMPNPGNPASGTGGLLIYDISSGTMGSLLYNKTTYDHAFALKTAGSLAYVQTGSNGFYQYLRLEVINISNGNILYDQQYSIGNQSDIALTPNGSKVLLVDGFTTDLRVINLDGTGVPTGLGTTYPIVDGGSNIAISSDSGTAYVTSVGTNNSGTGTSIKVVDINAGTLITSINLGFKPGGNVLSLNGSTLFVTPESGSYIATIDVATNTVTGTFNTVAGGGLAVNPLNGMLWQSNTSANLVSVIGSASSSTLVLNTTPNKIGVAAGTYNLVTVDEYGRVTNGTNASTSFTVSTIASSGTLNLTSAAGDYAFISGSTTISSITLAEGREFTTKFSGSLTITNSASLIAPGNANFVTANGDVIKWRGESGGVVRAVGGLKANGQQIGSTLDNVVIGGTTPVAATFTQINGGQLAGIRNPLLNPDMRVWQRGTSINISSTSLTFTADRWAFLQASGTVNATVSKQTNPATGIASSLRLQRNSGNTNTTLIQLGQAIESSNIIRFQGQQVTLSFYAKCGSNYSASGNQLVVQAQTGTVADEGSSGFLTSTWTGLATPLNSTIVLSTTRTKYSITGALAAAILELGIRFIFTPTGTAGTNDWFEIDSIMLEMGSVSTPFESRLLSAEVMECKRHYDFGTSVTVHGCSNSSGNSIGGYIPFKNSMRIAPTIALTNISYTNASNASAGSITTEGFSLDGDTTAASGAAIISLNFSASADL